MKKKIILGIALSCIIANISFAKAEIYGQFLFTPMNPGKWQTLVRVNINN